VKAYVQDAIGSYGERDLEPPRPGPGEVILKMRAALTCGTDLKLLSRGHPRIALPATMGHELCGEVAALGDGVAGWKLGERVVPGVSGPCGHCRECRAGRENLCPSAHADRTWGAFADRVRVPAAVVASSLHRVPAGLDDEVAAFLDPLASVLHGWSRLREPRGAVLVYGAGALALLWAAVASRRGLAVIVAGRRPERASLAERFGARFVRVDGGGAPELAESADLAVDATGDARVWERLPFLVRPGGQVLLFGGCAPGAAVTFDAARLHYAEITLSGAFHYAPRDAREALEALASGEVDPRPLIAGRGPLSALPGFLDAQARGAGVRYAVRGDA